MLVSVREAKASLSRLLEAAARGEEIVITCDGKPKARLVGLAKSAPFRVNPKLLAVRSPPGSTTAEEIVRQDRDSRG